MTKAKNNPTDWENAEQNGGENWESLSTGFSPLWKPEKGNAIVVLPTGVHAFKIKKNAKVKTASYAIECILKGGSLGNFYNGRGEAVSVAVGDSVTVGSSYNLVGEDKLVVIEKKIVRLSRMTDLLAKDNQAFRIVFNGKVKLEGGRSVNDYTMQVPKGYKEKFAQFKA